MGFNSFEFVGFFLVVYLAYTILQHRYQNILLLVASYWFYAAWDWRFLGLIIASTCVDYFCGLAIHAARDRRRKRGFLLASLITNLGLLAVFKYLGFFAESLTSLASSMGLALDPITLNIVLPVGISFYTFQTLSYTIDIHRGRIEPTRNFLSFAVFVAFFPQLVAGPIERASRLLPQMERKRHVTLAGIQEGIWLIARGYFKKVVLADNLAPFTSAVFNAPASAEGPEILFAVYAFAFQIYGDFSGYSDIARGISKLMGFDLMVNFRMPYFATNPRDFWTRWHISLSTWLRDYLYIPLGGNRSGESRTLINLSLTMLIGGLWHGAAWNFVIWGAFHGLILGIHRVYDRIVGAAKGRSRLEEANGRDENRDFSRRSVSWYLRVIFFFHVTCIGWLLFAVKSLSDVPVLLGNLFNSSSLGNGLVLQTLAAFALPLLAVEWFEFRRDVENAAIRLPPTQQLAWFCIVIVLIVFAGSFQPQEFIYFQF